MPDYDYDATNYDRTEEDVVEGTPVDEETTVEEEAVSEPSEPTNKTAGLLRSSDPNQSTQSTQD